MASDTHTPEQTADTQGLSFLRGGQVGRINRRYSRFILLMKFALPFSALVLVAMIALWPQLDDPRFAPAGSFLEPEAGQTTVVSPRYVGVDNDDQPYAVMARRAVSPAEGSGQINMQDPEAEITLRSGRFITLRSDAAVYFDAADELQLDENVRLTRDDGYTFVTSTARAMLSDGWIEGHQPVQGMGPGGTIEAEGFRIEDDGDTVIFTGRSKLVLTNNAGSTSQ